MQTITIMLLQLFLYFYLFHVEPNSSPQSDFYPLATLVLFATNIYFLFVAPENSNVFEKGDFGKL